MGTRNFVGQLKDCGYEAQIERLERWISVGEDQAARLGSKTKSFLN